MHLNGINSYFLPCIYDVQIVSALYDVQIVIGKNSFVPILTTYSIPSSTALGISISLTAVVLIQERKEGLIDRTWVAGVNVSEVLISQVLTQSFILVVQIVLMLVFVLFVFKVSIYV